MLTFSDDSSSYFVLWSLLEKHHADLYYSFTDNVNPHEMDSGAFFCATGRGLAGRFLFANTAVTNYEIVIYK